MKQQSENRAATMALTRPITERIQAYVEAEDGGLQKDVQDFLGERLPQIPHRTQVRSWLHGTNEPSMGTGILLQEFLKEKVIPWERKKARREKAAAKKNLGARTMIAKDRAAAKRKGAK